MSFFEQRWWVFVLRGALAILFGFLCFVRPGIGLLAFTTLVSLFLLADGISALAAIGKTRRAGEPWGWLVFDGLCGLIGGIGAWIYPGMTAFVLLVFIAVWSIAIGISRIVLAIDLRQVIEHEWLLIASGLLAIAFGVFALFRPGAGALAILWTIGVYAVAFGAMLVGLGFRLRGLTNRRAVPPPTPA